MASLRYTEHGERIPLNLVETDRLRLLPGTEIGIETSIEIPGKGDHKLEITLQFENPNVTVDDGYGPDPKLVRLLLGDILQLGSDSWKELLLSYESINYLSFFVDYCPNEVDDDERYGDPVDTYCTMLSQIFAQHCKLKLEWLAVGKEGGRVFASLTIGKQTMHADINYHTVREYIERTEKVVAS